MHFFHHYSVFFYADYGILYEELLVRAKKTQVVLHMLYYTYGSTYSRNGPNVPYMQYKMFTFIKLQ